MASGAAATNFPWVNSPMISPTKRPIDTPLSARRPYHHRSMVFAFVNSESRVTACSIDGENVRLKALTPMVSIERYDSECE